MKRTHYSLAVLFIAVLTGCVSNSFFEPTTIAKPGNAMVYVYRPAATNPGKKPLTLSYPEVMVNDQSAGFLKYKEYIPIEVEPGQHEFLVTGLTRDAKWEPRDRSYKLTVKAGQSYFLRFRVEFDTAKMTLNNFRSQYTITFNPVPEVDAQYEIRDTKNSRRK